MTTNNTTAATETTETVEIPKGHKRCTKCNTILPVASFCKQSSTKDGLKPHCRACNAKYRREYYQKNKAKENAQSRAFREANPDYLTNWFEACKQSGCYSITCTETGRIYYGSTSHLYRRKKQHMNSLAAGTHPVETMQADYNRYGAESFVFEVVTYCEPRHLKLNEAALVNEWIFQDLSYNTNRVHV